MAVTSNTTRRIRKGSTLPATCSPGEVFVKESGGSEGVYACIATANSWVLLDVNEGDGTVTSVSVASANGLAGSVANPTTTPAITLSTTITGILKGNGTAISTAAAGTDYATPAAVALKANDADVVHDTGDETVAGVKTFSSDPLIPDEAYGVGWNGSLEPPTKNAVYDKIEGLGSISGLTTGQYVTAASATTIQTDGVKRYVALLTQSGTDAPTASVLENSLGGTLVWARTTTGRYTATLSGAFASASKVWIGGTRAFSLTADLDIFVFVHMVVTDANTITMNIGAAETPADSRLVNYPIEIRVYP